MIYKLDKVRVDIVSSVDPNKIGGFNISKWLQ